MKRILFLVLIGVALCSYAQQDTLKYRVSLTDKAATTYSLQYPERYLSEKAIARRVRQGLSVDSTDLPVCDAYVEAIRHAGVQIVVKGKWDNFVTVSCNDTTWIDRIAGFPFVRSVERVWKAPDPATVKVNSRREPITDKNVERVDWYGAAGKQIRMSNGDKLHDAGYCGKGMTIGILDSGFRNADEIPAMQNIRLLGVKDFVGGAESIYVKGSHGLMSLSCMAMNMPHVMVGTAPEAAYWLFCTEDEQSEHLVEQDYWAAAIEFADSVGVDLVNSSLGYHDFDDKTKDYTYCELDGKYALISRQASRAADKGIVVVCSAGNAGLGEWKKITPPADAENVLTVGAITTDRKLAPFSSVGNSADNRIKPDVMAVGMQASVMNVDGETTTVNGTSFSSPIMCGMVACLWQACPELTAKQVIEWVRRSGDRVDCPDNIFGYGVPDLWKTFQLVRKENRPEK